MTKGKRKWWRPLLQALTHIAGLIQWRQTRQGRFQGRLIAVRRRYVARVKHTPSGVQDANRYQPNRPRIVAASLAALKATGRQIRRTAARHRWVVQISAEDANKDFHRATWRAEYHRFYGQMTGAWDAHQPKAGTHAGNRLIDYLGVLGRGVTLTRSWISKVPKPKSLDHTAVVAEVHVSVRRLRRAAKVIVYRFGYASGRFDAPVEEYARYLRDLMREENLDVLWSDEAEQHGVLTALRDALGDGFAVQKVGEYVQINRDATVDVGPKRKAAA